MKVGVQKITITLEYAKMVSVEDGFKYPPTWTETDLTQEVRQLVSDKRPDLLLTKTEARALPPIEVK